MLPLSPPPMKATVGSQALVSFVSKICTQFTRHTLPPSLQVLLDKNPHIKTVVNKVGNIDNTFRVFAMELLAGEPRTEAEVVQHGARFRLDMAQVCVCDWV